MKKGLTISVLILALFAMCVMTSCSNEDLEIINVEEQTDGSHWERADITLHVNRVDFDLQGVTRSSDVIWKDGDRIYLILKDKDGNNVQAHVEYDATSASWGQVEYDGYKSYLTCTVPRVVEAYYFDGNVNKTYSDITFDATTGVYVCKDGIYTYPSDGDLDVSISLVPLTSRIRFTGEINDSISILSGFKTYDNFSLITGQMTESLSEVRIYVDATGSTPYVYGLFSNPNEPSLDVVCNKHRYNTIFELSTNVLQVGHSGFMAIPTVDSHRGWKIITSPATGISLNNNSLSLCVGEVYTLNVNITPTDALSEFVWSSSNPSVVTVSDAGVVTAVAAGNATITVTDKLTGLQSTCSVLVINRSYSVILNSQWRLSTSIYTPDASIYDGVYESYSNKGINDSYARMYIDIVGYKRFKFYIRSDAEGIFDYVMVSQLNKTITGTTSYDNTSLVKSHTRGNQNSSTNISGYKLVEFTNIDETRTHRITIVYRKDSSTSSGSDRGYLLIPKNQ